MVEHGEYIVKAKGPIITATFIGMFNDIASKKVCTAMEELINGMNGAKFCVIFNMLDYEGSTPEAHIIGDKHFQWIEKQNCLGRAVVTTGSALIDISRNEQASLRESNIDSEMFKTEDGAKTWLLSLLKD